ncbi:cob(I)yrinic acid a,c-diamide adenosyltransferase [Streptomonospora nanhaiensis]|uniref:cob(I)yrinic acid a,c-diamide adenosyltransferase n=1 Tax=Streptomonospora nanhaiensis TaxID=1323731 RepID=UPI001C9939D1|nr:cob(I)yrinic acid a,c-diamide adenosyltransferase [Streptomonospora nanhaiensis]MBX9390627.1 cob(I)yrinic acid a,c-diamide adenosyltransferase [Streptomonospora nanhaiensis]
MTNHRDPDSPVVLSRIYTRVGDDGSTALGDLSRTRKTDLRLAAYADVEEANAAIGTALALGGDIPDDVRAVLGRVQNELFDLGADLSRPVVPSDDTAEYPPLRVEPTYVERLEADCDRYNADLPTLRSFLLPGGTPAVALMHTARVVVRRAERSAWAAIEAHGDTVNPLTARYLNRLSDLLFVLCRVLAPHGTEVLWKPGGER